MIVVTMTPWLKEMVEGVLSHQTLQFVIDGNKVVLSIPNPEMRVDDAEFEENEVYSIDIVASTDDGKPKLLDEKQTTIYKQDVNKSYNLKMEASRFISSEIGQKFPIMPFTASLPGVWKRRGPGWDWLNVLIMNFFSHIPFYMKNLTKAGDAHKAGNKGEFVDGGFASAGC